jgi:hypothetical protein
MGGSAGRPTSLAPTGSGRTTTGTDSFFVRCCNLFARSIYFRSAIYFHSFGSPANANGPSVLSRPRTNYAIAGTEYKIDMAGTPPIGWKRTSSWSRNPLPH